MNLFKVSLYSLLILITLPHSLWEAAIIVSISGVLNMWINSEVTGLHARVSSASAAQVGSLHLSVTSRSRCAHAPLRDDLRHASVSRIFRSHVILGCHCSALILAALDLGVAHSVQVRLRVAEL